MQTKMSQAVRRSAAGNGADPHRVRPATPKREGESVEARLLRVEARLDAAAAWAAAVADTMKLLRERVSALERDAATRAGREAMHYDRCMSLLTDARKQAAAARSKCGPF